MIHRALLLTALVLSLHLEAANAAQGREVLVRPSDPPATVHNLVRSLGPGGTVRFSAGVYSKGLHITDLRGTPQAPIRITADPGVSIEGWRDKASKAFGPGSGILLEKSSNVSIEGLSISGFERGITLGGCQMVTLKGNTITDVANYGIMSYRSDATTIVDNRIERAHLEHGIYISDAATRIIISKNFIRDTHVNGIHINGAVAAPIIDSNRFERTGSFPTKEGGAALTLIGGTTSPLVEKNQFKNIHGQGVTVDAPNAVFNANSFESCAWSSILGLPRSMNLRLSNNIFQDPKVIPLVLSSAILSTLQASGDRFSAGIPVCQLNESQRTFTLKDWQGMGKDVR